jgi:hypothetical protein
MVRESAATGGDFNLMGFAPRRSRVVGRIGCAIRRPGLALRFRASVISIR